MAMNFSSIAAKEYRNSLIFTALAERETEPDYHRILTELATFEKSHFEFWRKLANPGQTYRVSPLTIRLYQILRQVFGLTFVIKFLEMQEGQMIDEIRQFLFANDHPAKKDIETVLLVEEQQEQKLIKQIREDRVEFTGSIVLGLNDGIIELSGALTGFSFAFRHNPTVVLAGIILGISASLSMGSSAYLQAVHERGKEPQKAALYVGLSYFLVLALLIWPFLVSASQLIPVILMIISIFIIVAGLSFYTSVVFSRKFMEDFTMMLTFSIGTAIVTFLIGTAARKLLGVSI